MFIYACENAYTHAYAYADDRHSHAVLHVECTATEKLTLDDDVSYLVVADFENDELSFDVDHQKFPDVDQCGHREEYALAKGRSIRSDHRLSHADLSMSFCPSSSIVTDAVLPSIF